VVLFFFASRGSDNIATIRTAIQIQDRMSQPMRAMHNAVSMMVNQMEAMHVASGQMMDTSSVELARRELASAAQAISSMEQEVNNASGAQQRFTNNIRDGTSAADGLLNKIIGIVGAYLSIRTAGSILSMADDITNTTARLDIMNDGLQTTAQLNDKILASANRTYSSFDDTADMIAKLGILASEAFSSNDEIIAFAEQLNKHFTISGTELQGVQAVMLQLTQAMASGVLRGEELNSVLDNAPTVVRNIEKYLGVTRAEFRKMASDGQITADILKRALFAAADETNARFESMPNTFRDVWTEAMNNISAQFGDFFSRLTSVSDSKNFQKAIDDIVFSIGSLSSVATQALDLLITGGSFVYDNWSTIGPVIGALTTVLTGYVTALVAVKLAKMATVIWTALSTTATLIYAAAIGAGTGATWSMVAAAWGLNAALAANPIFIIIMAIALLIGIIYLAVAAINYFTGSSISATGIIAGAFMVLGTYIYNVIAYLWNIFAAIAEFFVNVWSHPMYSVKKLFYNLASNVLDRTIAMSSGWDNFATGFANAMIDAVNIAIKAWNWLIDLLPTDIAAKIGLAKGTEFSHRTSITSDLKNIKGALGDWVGETPADYWEAPKMEMKSLGAAWDTGYNWGANLFNRDSNEKDDAGKAIEEAMKNALGDKLDKANQNGDKTAKNTAKAAKSLEGAGEDLKYMRDLAEREAINRYTTAEINVDMKNENHINSEMDIDGVIDKFGEKVEETIAMLAEGGPTENV